MDQTEQLAPIGVTIDQAAELLQVSTKTIQRMITRGDLTAFTVGADEGTGGLRVTLESLDSLPERRKVDPTQRRQRR